MKKVLIAGAGAVGSYFISGLLESGKVQLYVLAEGERKARLKEKGIEVPYMRMTYHLISALEEKNAGMFGQE